MTEHAPLSLSLELEPGTEPLRGSLVAADGTARPFRGWLEMAEAIGAALRQADTTSHPLHEESQQ